ncbi:FAD-binding protein [Bifidobacterium jacchi]|uniref:UDP-N-acetylenolpyruvoylglucosamine reductase n=1 Tax=Bifidobacterium jacchi TaxID=2490545 RepID=A0A5N5RLH0_9BIFI|nr:FAD-binding protein [Bifidobacterium jacchi]KAB5608185.1 FAD-binding protein [Bifidobacterium jacchi]
MTSFADITTIGVGGHIARFVEPTTRVGVIEAVEDADSRGLPLLVIGGGSNMLISDEPFNGVVVRDARRAITVPDEAAPVEGDDRTVHVTAEAGVNWDDFVIFTLGIGLEGVEALSGIPGTVGASVVQNIGAYGQEVATAVESVEVWDRLAKQTREFAASDMGFAYRTSMLKAGMYAANAANESNATNEINTISEAEEAAATKTAAARPPRFFPTPRYVVLSVTFALRHSAYGTVGHAQLAKALGVQVGERMDTHAIRDSVLAVRLAKDMLEDPTRYAIPAMAGTKRQANIETELKRLAADHAADRAASHAASHTADRTAGSTAAAAADSTVGTAAVSAAAVNSAAGLPQPDFDRHSCGSFFVNPILTAQQAATLPADAPRYAATLPDGTPGVKTSAAWLIDHAGFHKGYPNTADAAASLSTRHTLALTNRGNATAADIARLAATIRDGVEAAYGIRLVPEPIVVGFDLR